MKLNTKMNAGVFQQLQSAFKFFIVIFLGLALSIAMGMGAGAENETTSIVNETINSTLSNESILSNTTIPILDSTIVNKSLLNPTNGTIEENETVFVANMSNITVEENLSTSLETFLFNVVLESVRFVDIKVSQFIPELNMTENTTTPKVYFMGYMDSYILSNVTATQVLSAVELDIYSENEINGTTETDLTICSYYINGTNDFVCLVPNASSYTMIASTEYLNETFMQYAVFNQTTIAEELLLNESITSNTLNETNTSIYASFTTEPVISSSSVSTLNITALFEEAYKGTSIYGTLLVNSTSENNTAMITVTSLGNNKSFNYSYELNDSLNFSCPIEHPISGIYAINITVVSDTETKSVYEVTYLEAPSLRLRIVQDATYNITDGVPIRSFATYDGELVDTPISLAVITPSGTEFSVTDSYPFIEFIADELGYHKVIAQTTYDGQNISIESGLVVGYYGFVDEPIENETFTVNDSSVENVSILSEELVHPSITGVAIEDVRCSVDSLYEVKSLVPLELVINSSENITTPMNASIAITDPDNMTMTYVAEINNASTEIMYLPVEVGNYTVDIFLESAMNATRAIKQTFSVVNRSAFGLEKYVLPALNTSIDLVGRRNMSISKFVYNETRDVFDLAINLSGMGEVRLHGISTLENISYIQSVASNDSQIQTEVFAIDEVNVTSADIVLAKTNVSNITRILYCEDWNETTATCAQWKGARVPFTQNETYVMFTVTHFTAYAGGFGNDSVLSIWDTSDTDKDNIVSYVDTLINFTANYTDNNTGSAITTATCNITLDGTVYDMVYSSTDEIYWFNTTLSTRGLYEYEVNCSDANYDPLEATDNVTVYSVANITAIDVESITLGYSADLECSVKDGYTSSALERYNVSFYSDIDGYLGWAETNISGIAQMSFEPSYGTHSITCNITDNETNYYKASTENEQTDSLDVYLSRLHSTKQMRYNESRAYNVTLEIRNDGFGALYNVTVSDFVPQTYRTIFIDSYDWNVSTTPETNVGYGTLYYWNISEISPRSSVNITYSIIGNSTTAIEDVSDSYIIGLTYSLD